MLLFTFKVRNILVWPLVAVAVPDMFPSPTQPAGGDGDGGGEVVVQCMTEIKKKKIDCVGNFVPFYFYSDSRIKCFGKIS